MATHLWYVMHWLTVNGRRLRATSWHPDEEAAKEAAAKFNDEDLIWVGWYDPGPYKTEKSGDAD